MPCVWVSVHGGAPRLRKAEVPLIRARCEHAGDGNTASGRAHNLAVAEAPLTVASTLPPDPTVSEPRVPSCPRCDAPTRERDRYCMVCGHALDEPVTPPAVPQRPDPSPVSALPAVEPADDGDVDLVSCPACGASNAARRRRCGRCGRSLVAPSEPRPVPVPDPGQMVPVPAAASAQTSGWHDEPTDPPGAPSSRGRRRRGVGLLVVVLGMVLGTGLGVAAGTGLGPFATLEPVTFDPTAYPRDPAVQQPATTGSSSTAVGGGGREFGPEHTVDGELTTAWRPDGEAEGARLRHGFVAPVWVTRIEVATGDQSGPDAFAGTGRVTEALIDLGAQRLDVDLADQVGVQLVTLPDPVLTDQVTWEVTGVAGDVPAIAEVRYVGWPADESDREAFRQRG